MNKVDLKYIYTRTKQLILKPATIWSEVLEEDFSEKEIFRSYVIPVAILTSTITLLLSLLDYSVFEAIELGVINLLAITVGTWLVYWLAKEYLFGKLHIASNQALNLSVYCSIIFMVFHSMSSALGEGFLGQLFALFSLAFIRTLYVGVHKTPKLKPEQRTNAFVIMCLSIICIPVIITHLLRIILGISAFNI